MMKPNTSSPRPSRTNSDLATQLAVVLSTARRGVVVSQLSTGPRSFDDLVDDVTTAERRRADRDGPGPSRTDVAISLYHRHLPKLAEEGLLADGFEEHVSLTRAGERCARLLDDDPTF